MVKTVIVMLVAVTASTLGDILLAQGMKSIGEVDFRSLSGLVQTLGRVARTPKVWGAIALLGTFFFCWISILSWADLSVALPMTALTYVQSAVLAGPLLGERVTGVRWIGTALICLGVVLVTYSGTEAHAL